VPFKLIEEVVRSWEFAAVIDGGVLRLMADASSDSTGWESGTSAHRMHAVLRVLSGSGEGAGGIRVKPPFRVAEAESLHA
jgi:hypothetical protein